MLSKKVLALCSLLTAFVVFRYFKPSPSATKDDKGPDTKTRLSISPSNFRQDHIYYGKNLQARQKEWNDLLSEVNSWPRSRRVPDVIGIGVRKCGTGALQHFLQNHPLVSVGSSEVHYYDKNLKKGVEFYKSMLATATPNQLIMEKTPAYFTSLPGDLPSMIKADSPQVKLILILCDPVSRAFSDYAMRDDRSGGNFLELNFDKYLEKYFEPVKKLFRNLTMRDDQSVVADVIKGLKKTKRMYSFAYGVYAYFIRRWVEVFAPAHLLVINGEQFIEDPGFVIEKVQNYLTIPTLLRKVDFVRHPITGLFCLRPWWNSTYDFESESLSQGPWYDNLICGGEGKGRTRSLNPGYKLSPESAQTLREFYAPFNEILYSMLNQRFEW